MRNCAFTICTGSYAGLAMALRDSFLRYNSNFDFFIIYIDQVATVAPDTILGDEVIDSYDSQINIKHLQFKYNITEYATCLKPFSILFLFNKGYDKVLYFDPDILFFSEFNEVLDDDCSVFLTPHMLMIPEGDDYVDGEINFLRFGTFNCGFVGFNKKDDSIKLVDWWARRLLNHSFAEGDNGCYTDQKWMDMVPSFIESLHVNIIRNMGCNLATWNYHERKIISHGEESRVLERCSENDPKSKPVVFVHYSGYDFKRMLSDQNDKQFKNITRYRDTDILAVKYRAALKTTESLKYMAISYKFSKYENGDTINAFHRRIFNGLLRRGYECNDPFACGDDSFHVLLQKSGFTFVKRKEYVASAENFGIIANMTRGYTGRFEPLLKFMFRILKEQKYITVINALRKYMNMEQHTFLVKIKNDDQYNYR